MLPPSVLCRRASLYSLRSCSTITPPHVADAPTGAATATPDYSRDTMHPHSQANNTDTEQTMLTQ